MHTYLKSVPYQIPKHAITQLKQAAARLELVEVSDGIKASQWIWRKHRTLEDAVECNSGLDAWLAHVTNAARFASVELQHYMANAEPCQELHVGFRFLRLDKPVVNDPFEPLDLDQTLLRAHPPAVDPSGSAPGARRLLGSALLNVNTTNNLNATSSQSEGLGSALATIAGNDPKLTEQFVPQNGPLCVFAHWSTLQSKRLGTQALTEQQLTRVGVTLLSPPVIQRPPSDQEGKSSTEATSTSTRNSEVNAHWPSNEEILNEVGLEFDAAWRRGCLIPGPAAVGRISSGFLHCFSRDLNPWIVPTGFDSGVSSSTADSLIRSILDNQVLEMLPLNDFFIAAGVQSEALASPTMVNNTQGRQSTLFPMVLIEFTWMTAAEVVHGSDGEVESAANKFIDALDNQLYACAETFVSDKIEAAGELPNLLYYSRPHSEASRQADTFTATLLAKASVNSTTKSRTEALQLMTLTVPRDILSNGSSSIPAIPVLGLRLSPVPSTLAGIHIVAERMIEVAFTALSEAERDSSWLPIQRALTASASASSLLDRMYSVLNHELDAANANPEAVSSQQFVSSLLLKTVSSIAVADQLASEGRRLLARGYYLCAKAIMIGALLALRQFGFDPQLCAETFKLEKTQETLSAQSKLMTALSGGGRLLIGWMRHALGRAKALCESATRTTSSTKGPDVTEEKCLLRGPELAELKVLEVESRGLLLGQPLAALALAEEFATDLFHETNTGTKNWIGTISQSFWEKIVLRLASCLCNLPRLGMLGKEVFAYLTGRAQNPALAQLMDKARALWQDNLEKASLTQDAFSEAIQAPSEDARKQQEVERWEYNEMHIGWASGKLLSALANSFNTSERGKPYVDHVSEFREDPEYTLTGVSGAQDLVLPLLDYLPSGMTAFRHSTLQDTNPHAICNQFPEICADPEEPDAETPTSIRSLYKDCDGGGGCRPVLSSFPSFPASPPSRTDITNEGTPQTEYCSHYLVTRKTVDPGSVLLRCSPLAYVDCTYDDLRRLALLHEERNAPGELTRKSTLIMGLNVPQPSTFAEADALSHKRSGSVGYRLHHWFLPGPVYMSWGFSSTGLGDLGNDDPTIRGLVQSKTEEIARIREVYESAKQQQIPNTLVKGPLALAHDFHRWSFYVGVPKLLVNIVVTAARLRDPKHRQGIASYLSSLAPCREHVQALQSLHKALLVPELLADKEHTSRDRLQLMQTAPGVLRLLEGAFGGDVRALRLFLSILQYRLKLGPSEVTPKHVPLLQLAALWSLDIDALLLAISNASTTYTLPHPVQVSSRIDSRFDLVSPARFSFRGTSISKDSEMKQGESQSTLSTATIQSTHDKCFHATSEETTSNLALNIRFGLAFYFQLGAAHSVAATSNSAIEYVVSSQVELADQRTIGAVAAEDLLYGPVLQLTAERTLNKSEPVLIRPPDILASASVGALHAASYPWHLRRVLSAVHALRGTGSGLGHILPLPDIRCFLAPWLYPIPRPIEALSQALTITNGKPVGEMPMAKFLPKPLRHNVSLTSQNQATNVTANYFTRPAGLPPYVLPYLETCYRTRRENDLESMACQYCERRLQESSDIEERKLARGDAAGETPEVANLQLPQDLEMCRMYPSLPQSAPLAMAPNAYSCPNCKKSIPARFLGSPNAGSSDAIGVGAEDLIRTIALGLNHLAQCIFTEYADALHFAPVTDSQAGQVVTFTEVDIMTWVSATVRWYLSSEAILQKLFEKLQVEEKSDRAETTTKAVPLRDEEILTLKDNFEGLDGIEGLSDRENAVQLGGAFVRRRNLVRTLLRYQTEVVDRYLSVSHPLQVQLRGLCFLAHTLQCVTLARFLAWRLSKQALALSIAVERKEAIPASMKDLPRPIRSLQYMLESQSVRSGFDAHYALESALDAWPPSSIMRGPLAPPLRSLDAGTTTRKAISATAWPAAALTPGLWVALAHLWSRQGSKGRELVHATFEGFRACLVNSGQSYARTSAASAVLLQGSAGNAELNRTWYAFVVQNPGVLILDVESPHASKSLSTVGGTRILEKLLFGSAVRGGGATTKATYP